MPHCTSIRWTRRRWRNRSRRSSMRKRRHRSGARRKSFFPGTPGSKMPGPPWSSTERSLMPKTSLVVVVTPVHNGLEHTKSFLPSLAKQTHPNLKVILIDDGSTDGSATWIKDHHKDVEVLAGDGSLWWAGATNQGVRSAQRLRADYVLTINNDTELAPDAIEELVKYAQTHPKTLVGSTVCYLRD